MKMGITLLEGNIWSATMTTSWHSVVLHMTYRCTPCEPRKTRYGTSGVPPADAWASLGLAVAGQHAIVNIEEGVDFFALHGRQAEMLT